MQLFTRRVTWIQTSASQWAKKCVINFKYFAHIISQYHSVLHIAEPGKQEALKAVNSTPNRKTSLASSTSPYNNVLIVLELCKEREQLSHWQGLYNLVWVRNSGVYRCLQIYRLRRIILNQTCSVIVFHSSVLPCPCRLLSNQLYCGVMKALKEASPLLFRTPDFHSWLGLCIHTYPVFCWKWFFFLEIPNRVKNTVFVQRAIPAAVLWMTWMTVLLQG